MYSVALVAAFALGFAFQGFRVGTSRSVEGSEESMTRLEAVVRETLGAHLDRSSERTRGVVQRELAIWRESRSGLPADGTASEEGERGGGTGMSVAGRVDNEEQLDLEAKASELLRSARAGRAWTREDESEYFRLLDSLPPDERQEKIDEVSRSVYRGEIQIDPSYFEGLLPD